MQWTVKRDDVVRLTLAGGEWIDVRQQLTVGEEREIARRSARSYQQGTAENQGQFTIDYDVTRFGLVQAAAYLVGWSAPMPLPINYSLEKRIAIVESLNPEAYTAIEEALTTYLRERDAARADEKKAPATPSGEKESKPIAPLPAA
jgi:hypothetical protein